MRGLRRATRTLLRFDRGWAGCPVRPDATRPSRLPGARPRTLRDQGPARRRPVEHPAWARHQHHPAVRVGAAPHTRRLDDRDHRAGIPARRRAGERRHPRVPPTRGPRRRGQERRPPGPRRHPADRSAGPAPRGTAIRNARQPLRRTGAGIPATSAPRGTDPGNDRPERPRALRVGHRDERDPRCGASAGRDRRHGADAGPDGHRPAGRRPRGLRQSSRPPRRGARPRARAPAPQGAGSRPSTGRRLRRARRHA